MPFRFARGRREERSGSWDESRETRVASTSNAARKSPNAKRCASSENRGAHSRRSRPNPPPTEPHRLGEDALVTDGSRRAIIAAFLANLGIALAKLVAYFFTGAA